MRVLDLFSGIGGFSLGLERAGMEAVAFCEVDPFCQKVLAKHWPNVPIYDDVRTLTKEKLEADGITADLICGGYPCQPFSTAGKRQGAGDDRHLWPEMYRLIETLRPRWVLAENVAGHISMGLDSVLSDLEAANYTWWAFVIPACAVDAKHRRDRVWIVANPSQQQRNGGNDHAGISARPQEIPESGNSGGAADVANANSGRPSRPGRAVRQMRPAQERDWQEHRVGNDGRWPTEPSVGRVAHGVPNRVDRLKSLGNAVVPQIPEIIGRAIMEVNHA